MSAELKVGNIGTIEQKAWHALNTGEVLRDLKVHDDGLSTEEAARRLQRYGHN